MAGPNTLKRVREDDGESSSSDQPMKRSSLGEGGGVRASPRRTSGPFSRIFLPGRDVIPPAATAPCPAQEEFTNDLVKLVSAFSVYAAAAQNDSLTKDVAELRLADQTQQTGHAILQLIQAIKDGQTPIPPLPPLADTDARLTQLEGEIAGLKASFAGELAAREQKYLEEITNVKEELVRIEKQGKEAKEALRRELAHRITPLPPHGHSSLPPPAALDPSSSRDPRISLPIISNPGGRPIHPSPLRNAIPVDATSPPHSPPSPPPPSSNTPNSPTSPELAFVTFDKLRTFKHETIRVHEKLKGELSQKFTTIDDKLRELEQLIRVEGSTGDASGRTSEPGGDGAGSQEERPVGPLAEDVESRTAFGASTAPSDVLTGRIDVVERRMVISDSVFSDLDAKVTEQLAVHSNRVQELEGRFFTALDPATLSELVHEIVSLLRLGERFSSLENDGSEIEHRTSALEEIAARHAAQRTDSAPPSFALEIGDLSNETRLAVERELSDPVRWGTFAELLQTWFPARAEVEALRGRVDKIQSTFAVLSQDMRSEC